MASQTVSVRHIDDLRGRGLVAEVDFVEGDSILCVPYDIAVLYSPFVKETCYRCFEHVDVFPQRLDEGAGKYLRYECTACNHLVLCPACVEALAVEVQQMPQAGDSAAVSSAVDHEVIQQHPVLQAHRHACSWFCSLPASVRDGDTDYLRFVLQYGSRVLLGDNRLLMAVGELCTNTAQQSVEARDFCESFAHRVVGTFAAQGFCIDTDHLRDVLLRTKCNSIGYPFNEEETMGWALQEELCMINHSCAPNAAILRPRGEGPAVPRSMLELVARRPIKAGEEITIAYIDVEAYAHDLGARRRRLLENYGFLCRCQRCTNETNK